MTIIIGFSARKQGGKGTMCKFIEKNADALFGGIGMKVKTYSMAGPLKETCRKVLGLTYEQCYGTDDDKNSLTKYLWENMPHYPRLLEKEREKARLEIEKEYENKWPIVRLIDNLMGVPASRVENMVWFRIPKGQMTARQVLQEVGTGVFRTMYANVWNEACIRAIKEDNANVALIDDIRFPDEAEATKAAGGKVIRLTRAPFAAQDEHPSETSMDKYTNFDAVIPNGNLSPNDSCSYLVKHLQKMGMVHELRRPGHFVGNNGEQLNDLPHVWL